MAGYAAVVPVVTALALVTLALRFRDPDRRTPVSAAVEVLSVTLAAALVVQLLLLGTSWGEVTATSGLFLLFGATVAFVLSMVRVVSAVAITRRWRQVPLDAVLSFAAVSAIAAVLSGAMLVSAFGLEVAALVATVAVLRATAEPWQADRVVGRWSWSRRRPSAGW